MDLTIEKNKLIATNIPQWKPFGAILYGAIAGGVIGVANEEIAAGLAVFAIVSILGKVLTFIESRGTYHHIEIDLENKQLIAQKLFMNKTIKTLHIENIDPNKFRYSVFNFKKKLFRRYYLKYCDVDEHAMLFVVTDKAYKAEIDKLFESKGYEIKLSSSKLGQFLVRH